MRTVVACLFLGAALLVACTSRLPSTVLNTAPNTVLQELRTQGVPCDVTLGGDTVRYLGFVATPKEPLPGDAVAITHYWVAQKPLTKPYQVFVHVLADGAQGWVAHGDHAPIPSPETWPVGKVIRDEHTLNLPNTLPAARLALRVGLYQGNERLPVDAPRAHLGDNRIVAGDIPVAGTPPPRPRYQAPKRRAVVTLDGVTAEQEWAPSTWSEGFTLSRGDRPAQLASAFRVLWDSERLYVAMQTDDPDLQATLSVRDDPVYREEALEIFLDPTSNRKDYIELQASPANTLFDARFTGGPRRNMDTRYNVVVQSAVQARGTLNQPTDVDHGFTVEWQIDAASIPGLSVPLTAGQCVRANFFRIAKDRTTAGNRSEESAWSPPLMGDFHNLERFGDLCLSE